MCLKLAYRYLHNITVFALSMNLDTKNAIVKNPIKAGV